MKRQCPIPAIKISAEELNKALRQYNQPTIDFAQILLPGETIEEWMQEFKAANQGGYLLHDTKKGAQLNDYCLWYGSSAQAVMNQNIINIYDAMTTGEQPKIVYPRAFQNALRNQWGKAR